jgi:xylose dehydrogenase (NAD/NADP)
VNLGLLSTARINDAILAAAEGVEGLQITAVAARDVARAKAYAAEHGIGGWYGGYDDLLADSSIDAVYISVPNALHIPWSMAAIEAGKHVLCEKPLSRDAAAVAEAFELATSKGVVLLEGLMWRHNPQTARLLGLIAEGTIGETRLVRASFSFPLQGNADFRLDPALDGGALSDVGSYCASGVRLFAGEPESVSALAVERNGVDVRLVAVLRHAGGALSQIDCGMDLPDRASLEVVGADGILRAEDAWDCARVGIDLVRPDGEAVFIAVENDDSFRLELENFAGVIAGRAEPLINAADTIAQARLLGCIAASAERGGAAVSL